MSQLRWFRRIFGGGRVEDKPDLAAFFQSLSPVKVGRDGYADLDRYRDFRQVFSTPEGRRVLHQIIDYCEGPPRTEQGADQIHRNIFRDGRRDGGLWIVKTMNAVPLEKAQRAEGG